MFGKGFHLNEQTLSVVGEIGRHMPGGFFIYKAEQPEELLYANKAVFDIFGCNDLDEFKVLTGYTFKGMLHPDDYTAISASINEQIEVSEDNFDYVEYRIIRKDGAVRWVDDYGHYTETEAYGGIYYVFISDITEKREQMNTDLAMRNAVIEALSKSYHTLWLINDVETESFSLYRGDVAGETAHTAPIRDALNRMRFSQAKEYYINTTVAPEDRDWMSRELSIRSILSHVSEKPQWNVNYRRLMDDGSARYFRIEFAKMDMPNGKTGIVCGFKDVDEEFRKLLEDEKQELRQKQMITALASDYWSVYYIELDKDYGICYQEHDDIEDGFVVGEEFPYLESVTAYANRYITDKYRDEFIQFVQPEAIKRGLAEQRVISYRYMVHRHGRDSYEMVRFAGVRHPEDRDDHTVHAVGACFTNIDDEMRNTMEQSLALREALAAAEEASKAKTAFLSNMSHEIRTPMNAIIGLDNIALSDENIPEKTREYLEKINTSAQHLLNIINDILDMSRIESGRMVIKNDEFSFNKALEQVNTIISGQCRDKDIDYECHIKGDVRDYYIGDHMKLQQVLINILGNAVKFTSAGGRVSFTIEAAARFNGRSTLQFIVSDTGIGMSKEYLPKIFDTFSQEDLSATSKYGSTGLGMSITKSIVELMNGDIRVESEKGVGTTFTVTITFADSDRKPEQIIGEELDPGEIRVLAIDDDPVACEHAQIVLRQVGISCDVALSGEEGLHMAELRHARRDPYNLILVDWKMPGMDGIETTRRIREAMGNEAAIIILTSYSWEDVVDDARKAGVDTFVAKPLFASSVVDEFSEAFRKKHESRAERQAELSGRRVLLAEDVMINAEIMKMLFSMQGMEVDYAETGQAAVDLFIAHEPGYYDAVFMDMRMPVMDGLEASRTIRASGRDDAETIPIIALTANAFDEDVQRSMQAGLNAHLSKPVESDVLFDTLRGLIK